MSNENSSKEEEYNQLQSDLTSNESQQADCEAEITTLGEKIQTLKDAYDALDAEKEILKTTHAENSYIEFFLCLDIKWKGNKANYFFEKSKTGDLYTSYEKYIKKIDEAQDEINWEICELESQQNEKYGVLATLVDAWNSLCTSIENFWN